MLSYSVGRMEGPRAGLGGLGSIPGPDQPDMQAGTSSLPAVPRVTVASDPPAGVGSPTAWGWALLCVCHRHLTPLCLCFS